MEIFVHFIYNVVQIKDHIDQYFHTYFIRFELNKYLFFFNLPVTPAECLCRTTGFCEAKFTLGLNSYIRMHFCEKMDTRVAECTCIY